MMDRRKPWVLIIGDNERYIVVADDPIAAICAVRKLRGPAEYNNNVKSIRRLFARVVIVE
jgi:hypothetical protein